MNPVFPGRVEKGRLIRDDPVKYLLQLNKLEGCRVDESLKRRRETRSDNQNRYYWGVIIEILSEHCGYTKDEMHDALKYKFLSDRCPDEKGLVKIKSTAKLKTDEFIQYTNQIVIWAAEEMNVFIPDPSQMDY